MAITNEQLLTQRGYSEREKQAAKQFSNWSQSDLDTYIQNKLKAENPSIYKSDPAKLAAENQALRDKYGVAKDEYSYNDLGRLGLDLIWGYPEETNTSVVKRSSGGGGGGGGGVSRPELPPAPQMRSGRSMAELLGVIYDYDTIEGMYRDAVEKKHANLDAEIRRTQDMYYDSIGNSADVLMGVLRRGDRDAVRSGTAQGTQAATELSALLGVSAEAGQGATELAQARDDLVRKREEDLANVTKDALKYYNDLGINLGQLSASELNALVTAYASEVATIGGMYNTDVLAQIERERMASQERIAGQQISAQRDIAQWGNASNEEIARITGLSQKDVEQIRAEYQKEIARITAKSNEAIAAKYNSGSGGAGSNTGILSGADKASMIYARIADLKDGDGNIKPENMATYQALIKELETLSGMNLGSDAITVPTPSTNGSNTPAPKGSYEEFSTKYDQETYANALVLAKVNNQGILSPAVLGYIATRNTTKPSKIKWESKSTTHTSGSGRTHGGGGGLEF